MKPKVVSLKYQQNWQTFSYTDQRKKERRLKSLESEIKGHYYHSYRNKKHYKGIQTIVSNKSDNLDEMDKFL